LWINNISETDQNWGAGVFKFFGILENGFDWIFKIIEYELIIYVLNGVTYICDNHDDASTIII
jgi:hypothetical protein